jgi:CheY-like chemotaxis protein
MDIQMPLMNGYEATKRLEIKIRCYNSNNRNNGRDSRNEKCIAAGMNDYISKPIIKRVIEDALVKWTTT